MQSLAAMNAETQQMLRAVLAHSDGAVKAAAQANQKTQEQNSINMQRQLANNLDRVQQHFAMSDDQAQDFVNFAEDRGYTMEDFIDGQLLVNVVRDFKNMGTEPELAQLRAQRAVPSRLPRSWRCIWRGEVGPGQAAVHPLRL